MSWLLAAALFWGTCGATVGQGGEVRLTTDGRLKSDPVFVDRGGQELIYVVQDRPNQLRLMRMRVAERTAVAVNPEQRNNEFEPGVSADGNWLSFVQNRGNLSLALVIRNLEKNTEAEVKPAGGFAGPHCPAIMPDGSRVFYSFADKGRQLIVSVDMKGGDPKTVIEGAGIYNWPCFSPDGKRFAFGATRDGNFELYSANVDGNDVRRLTHEPRLDMRPRY